MDQQLARRLEDAVGWWHDGDSDLPLHAYLGMTRVEFRHWFRHGELAPPLARMDAGMLVYWPRAGVCWVCGDDASFLDLDFNAPVCGGICSWAGWEAMRLHDTPWRAW